MSYSVELTDSRAARVIASLAADLLDEIMARSGGRHFSVDVAATEALCRRYLDADLYTVILARDSVRGKAVGFVALCESHALYTEGAFGVIQEFYVAPEHRSIGIGAALLARAEEVARQRGWRRLELCTPPLPAFDRSLAFYQSKGFEVTGGRKMKRGVD